MPRNRYNAPVGQTSVHLRQSNRHAALLKSNVTCPVTEDARIIFSGQALTHRRQSVHFCENLSISPAPGGKTAFLTAFAKRITPLFAKAMPVTAPPAKAAAALKNNRFEALKDVLSELFEPAAKTIACFGQTAIQSMHRTHRSLSIVPEALSMHPDGHTLAPPPAFHAILFNLKAKNAFLCKKPQKCPDRTNRRAKNPFFPNSQNTDHDHRHRSTERKRNGKSSEQRIRVKQHKNGRAACRQRSEGNPRNDIARFLKIASFVTFRPEDKGNKVLPYPHRAKKGAIKPAAHERQQRNHCRRQKRADGKSAKQVHDRRAELNMKQLCRLWQKPEPRPRIYRGKNNSRRYSEIFKHFTFFIFSTDFQLFISA